ncbi:MAG: calcium/sodium antiporter, partial [Bacteroidota bacterium]
VSVKAALVGQGGVAIGSVVGSNIANLALIVGVSASISPMAVDRNLVRHDMPVMLGSMVLLIIFLIDGELGRIEGGILFAAAIAYTFESIRASRKQTRKERSAEASAEARSIAEGSEPAVQTDAVVPAPVWRNLLFVIGGIALLVYGADLLLTGAVELATQLGVSEAIIGLTLVALGTSLPELATTVVAAFRGHGEIALGNALGSNIFNVFGVLGPTALTIPLVGSDIGPDVLAIMVLIAVLTLIFLTTGGKTRRWEGGVLLTAYVAYLWWVVP